MSPDNKHYIRCFEALKESALFKNVKSDVMHSTLMHMTKEVWKAGVFKNSIESSDTLHFIISGRLKVYQVNPKSGREHTIFILSNGDIFDIFNLLGTNDHKVFWETIDELEVLSIPNKEIQKIILNNAVLNESVFKYLGERMLLLEQAAVDASMHNTLTRLANLLLKNINGETQKLELINNLPNDEIASLIGTTRAVVNRHIQELKKTGAISVKRKQIDINNIELLISIAEQKYLSNN